MAVKLFQDSENQGVRRLTIQQVYQLRDALSRGEDVAPLFEQFAQANEALQPTKRNPDDYVRN